MVQRRFSGRLREMLDRKEHRVSNVEEAPGGNKYSAQGLRDKRETRFVHAARMSNTARGYNGHAYEAETLYPKIIATRPC